MNPEVKEMWVAALRSGEYKQTTGHLNVIKGTESIPTGLCCLGVLCEVAVKNGVDVSIETLSPDFLHDTTIRVYDTETTVLPGSVMGWADLFDSDPLVFDALGEKAYLSELNDAGSTFSEIADLIERDL